MKVILLSLMMLFLLEAGEIGTDVVLDGKNGKYIKDGSAWKFSNNNGKVRLILYVDPDEQKKGEVFKPKTFELEEKYPKEDFVIQVIINLNATWIPDAVIESKLKDKQEKIPQREFIVDKEGVLVHKWGLKDDEYNILLFDKNNKLKFYKSGELSPQEIQKLLGIIETLVKEKN